MATILGTFGYTGFFPVAPATFASLVFVGVYLLPGGRFIAHPAVLLATLLISIPISTKLEGWYGHDAHCIVIDEVVGMQIVFTLAAPATTGLLLGFFFFRVFDVWKPFPARRSQDLPGGWGVVCDDVLAGLYGRAVMVIIAHFFPALGTFS
jgi:phosphatidylglycerophosphatase A